MAGLDDAVRLAETLCARICHDFSGSLGTLGGMLDLLQEQSTASNETLAAALDAADALEQRLKLLRAAWGGNPAGLTWEALRGLTAGLPGARRLVLDLDGVAPDVELAPEVGRAVLAWLMVAADSLPRGGRIVLAGGPVDLLLLIAGPNAAWPAELAACFSDEAAIAATFDRPRGLALPLAMLFARRAGLRPSMLLATAPADAPPPIRLTKSHAGQS